MSSGIATADLTIGSLFRIAQQKAWILHREIFLDYAAVAAVMVALLGGDGPIGFAILGALLASSLGTRVGGDETIAGTWEFTLTRPAGRGNWFDAHFLCGLVPLAGLLGLVLTSDLIGLSSHVGGWIADPLPDTSIPPGLTPSAYALPIAFAVLVYAFAFRFAVKERVPANVLVHRVSGLFAAGFALFLCGLAAALLQNYYPDLPLPDFSGDDPPDLTALALPVLAIATGLFLAARRSVVEREEIGSSDPEGARAGGTSMAFAVVAILLIALFAWAMFSARVSYAPSEAPIVTTKPDMNTTTPTANRPNDSTPNDSTPNEKTPDDKAPNDNTTSGE